MKIKELQITNIGPYKGNNRFDLSTTNDKNIIMIGGKNGSGKTTILKAIKIGLFGCFAYGYKNENSTYYKEIKSLLSDNAINNTYSIKISLEYIEKLSKDNYEILRGWQIVDGDINEKVEVSKNSSELDTSDSVEFINKLRSMTSPALINSFIFDGEKIGSIIENGQIKEYLESVFNSIFNIDLLEQFEADLTTYLNNELVNVDDSEYELTILLNQINTCKAELKNENEHLKNIKVRIQDLKAQIDSVQKTFANLGGVPKDAIREYRSFVKSIESQSEKNNKTLKEFYEDYLPYCIALDQLKIIEKQAEKELPVLYAEMLKEVQEYLNEDLSVYLNKLNIQDTKIVYKLSKKEIDNLHDLIILVSDKKEEALKILNTKDDLTDKLIKIKQTLTDNTAIESLGKIIDIVSSATSEFALLVNEQAQTEIKINELNNNRESLIKKYEDLLNKSKKEKSLGNSFILCTNTLKVCNDIKEYVKEEKLKKVSLTCCNLFNETIRKNNFITDIAIDNDFVLHLYSGEKQINESNLSAGEKQILISCIIWSMFKVSGRREMFVFDTPLARLDAENRITFSKNIISTISGQVVVLSTDTEFKDFSYNLIADKVAKNYLLNYDDVTNSTAVQEKYFGD